MNVSSLVFYFLILFAVNSVMAPSWVIAAGIQCETATVKTPPIFVVPTGYDAASDEDAVDRKKETSFNNYSQGAASTSNPATARGKPYIVPKRSIVQVSDTYRDLIERTGEFSKSRGDEWVPVRVISIPPENRKVQEASLKATKSVGRYQYPKDVVQAEVGSTGFLKVADLEKVAKQKDFVFVVKQDSELLTKLNNYVNQNDLKAIQPLALKLKRDSNGFYEVNQCCLEGTKRCTNYPVFQLLNVKDSHGNDVDVPVDTDCFVCPNNVFKSIVPIEENALNPIRSILSHPTLGLPEGSNDIKRVASVSNLNFVDSRGFVQIPVTGNEAKRTGPFNSLHYGAESGDADVYLKPDVACGFMQFLKSWNQTCKGRDECLIEFGDASHALHKGKVGGANSPWPHFDHADGECIDINTSRMSKSQLAPMINLFKKSGSGECYTTESNISKTGFCKYDTTRNPATGELVHKTHMHVCFASNISDFPKSVPNPKLKEACEKGVIP